MVVSHRQLLDQGWCCPVVVSPFKILRVDTLGISGYAVWAQTVGRVGWL